MPGAECLGKAIKRVQIQAQQSPRPRNQGDPQELRRRLAVPERFVKGTHDRRVHDAPGALILAEYNLSS